MKLILLTTLFLTALQTHAYVADTMHHAPNSDIAALRAYLAAAGIELPQSDDQLKQLDSDGDGMDDFAEWVMGMDPLHGEPQLQTSFPTPEPQSGMVIHMEMPPWFGHYAEVYCKNSLISNEWELADGWIPTHGSRQVQWQDVYRPEETSFYYMIFDATLDLDGDGYSDYREHYITKTDPTVYNDINTDNDWMHDWWELKLFGNLDQSGDDDFDSDTLLNKQELVWLPDHSVRMYSDPTLYDSDNEGLNDAQENDHLTNAMESDTDFDGFDDYTELKVARTDPNNPDVDSPLFASIR